MAAMPDDVIVAINKIDRLPQEQVLAAIKNAAALAKRCRGRSAGTCRDSSDRGFRAS